MLNTSYKLKMNGKLSRGIITILIANLLNLVINLVTNFLLPKYLTVETYAYIKTYQLYINYAGVFSLGYVDGMYLLYGGKNILEINKIELNRNIWTMRIFQLLIMFIMLGISVLSHKYILIMFSLSILPFNMAGYFKLLYQAVGEFKSYSKALNISAIAVFMCNMMLLFIFKSENYFNYLLTYLLVYLGIWIYLEYKIGNIIQIKNWYLDFSFEELIKNVKNGIQLMLGNFSSIIMTSLDRCFVMVLMDTFAFAQYSFAVSMENIIAVVTMPISTTLYNYFCVVSDTKQIKKILSYVILFATVVISSAFPGMLILQEWLKSYNSATEIMFYLFAAHIYYIIVKSVYVNLYKARKKIRLYLIKLMVDIFAGILFNALLFFVLRTKEAFAIGTLFSAVLWFLLCIPDFKDIVIDAKEIIYLVLETLVFILCGKYLNAIIGFCIYISFTITMILLLMKKSFIGLVIVCYNIISEKLGIRIV